MSAAAAHTPGPDAASGTRTALIVGPVLTALGIAWTAIAPSSAASAAVLVGLVTCIVGTHRFGRLGPEPRAQLDVPEAPLPAADADDEPSDDP